MSIENVRRAWRALSPPSPALRASRLQTHYAIQPLAALAEVAIEPEADFGHLSLTWDHEQACFLGRRTRAGLRAGLRPVGLELRILDDADRDVATMHLDGRTLDEAIAWLSEAARGDATTPLPLNRPTHDLPDHAVATGAAFTSKPEAAFRELAAWYASTSAFFSHVQAGTPGASPVRCWPHHFDLATLIVLDPHEADVEKARSIGIGFSPGDAHHDEPYVYVNPWPMPAMNALPEVGGPGTWHTTDWVGRVLTGTVLGSTPPVEQVDLVHAFVHAALEAECELLGVPMTRPTDERRKR